MSRIKPLAFDELTPELQSIMQAGQAMMGFIPNDGLLMAYRPALLKAMLGLVEAVYQQGSVSLELKKLLALMTSSVTGCQYCKAHTSFGALNLGIETEKIDAIWDYTNSPLYSDAEKVALDLARDGAMFPNAVTDKHFARLKIYFTEEQIVELVGVISLFAFLNRWNTTMNTDLEKEPQEAISVLKNLST